MRVKRALISVSDKEGLTDFVKELSDLGVKILSTGGTASFLKKAGIKIQEVSDVTGFPEMLDGRVKTLHPIIHAGILAKRDEKKHMETLKKNNIETIDLLVCNLYPFESTIKKPNVSIEEVIENIDIGGPTLVRAAAKNYKDVIVITDKKQYGTVLEFLKIKDNLSLKEPKTIPELSKLLDEDPKRIQSVLKHLIKENLVKPIKLRTAAKKCCHLTKKGEKLRDELVD